MKKIFAFAVLLLLIAPVIAHETNRPHPHVKTPIILGKGIAVSTDNPKDFGLLKIGLAKVTIALAGEETDVKVGVLVLDGIKYHLRNIDANESNASADVYLNDSKVGSLQVELVTKNDTDFWIGSLNLNSKNYNMYVLDAERRAKPEEVGEKVKDVCKESPEKCEEVAKGIGNRFCDKVDDESCREKIEEFCKENPEDSRCVGVFREFCSKHLEDSRCRTMLKSLCVTQPDLKACEEFCEKFPVSCGGTTSTSRSPCLSCPEGYVSADNGLICKPTCLGDRPPCKLKPIRCPNLTTLPPTSSTTTSSTTTSSITSTTLLPTTTSTLNNSTTTTTSTSTTSTTIGA